MATSVRKEKRQIDVLYVRSLALQLLVSYVMLYIHIMEGIYLLLH